MSLKDRLLTRKGAEAVTSPGAILLAGAGMSIGVLTGLPVVAAAGLGVAAWGAKVVAGLPKDPRARGGGRIDPHTLSDPWKRYVAEALDARRRFQDAIGATQPGPLRDRLDQIGDRVETAVDECWRIAQRGNALVKARRRLDTTPAERELAELERNAGEKWFAGSDAERTAEALRAQLESAERMEAVALGARDKLQLLDARLDEAVARAVELSVRADEPAELGGLGSDVDALVTEMEALRRGLEEAGA